MGTSYRLDARETLPDGVRRIANEQLVDAIGRLRGAVGKDRNEAIHEARKATKKVRALLRLVRDDLDKGERRRDNRALRDAARRLSAPRDAAVLVATLDALLARRPDAAAAAASVRELLEERRRETSRRVLEDEDAMARTADELDAVRARLGDWRLRSDGFEALAGGLRKSYGRGREAFARACQRPTDERMHEARKGVKGLWYHARVLRPLWPGPMDAVVEATDALGDLLGEDHDLAVLAETVGALEAEIGDPGAAEAVHALVAARRAELRERVWPLGRRVYADKPKAFVRRLGGLFDAWREETAWRLSAEEAALVRELLAAQAAGAPVEQRRARDRLRRHGVRAGDLDERLGHADGRPRIDVFEELVERGRVRITA